MTAIPRAATLALAILAATPALAADGLTTAAVNMRTGPGTGYEVVTTIPERGAVEIAGCEADSEWCRVGWRDAEGWVFSRYLALPGRARGSGTPPRLSELPTVSFEKDTSGALPVSRWEGRYGRRHDRLAEGQYGRSERPKLPAPASPEELRPKIESRSFGGRGVPPRSQPWLIPGSSRSGLD